MNPGATAFTVILRLRHLLRQRFRQSDQAGLRRHIVRLARIARLAHHRRNIDDAAPALLHHALQHLLDRQKRAGQIGGEHRVPIVFLHAQREAILGDRRRYSPGCRSADPWPLANASLIESGEARSIVDPASHLRRISRGGCFQFRGVARGQHHARARLAPARARRRRPMPRLAPVTNAVRLVMLFDHSKLILWPTPICATSCARSKRTTS